MRTYTGQSIPNIDTTAPADYPYGRLKNGTTATSNDGTPFQENSGHGMGDIYQAMIGLLEAAGITPNENPENKATDGYQILDALNYLYGNSAQPVAVLTCKTAAGVMETKNILGNGLSHTWTTNTYDTVNNQARFKLNITDAGDYVVQISKNHTTVLLNSSGDSVPFTAEASHSFAYGFFVNNLDANITLTAGKVAGTVAEADFESISGIILTVYRV